MVRALRILMFDKLVKVREGHVGIESIIIVDMSMKL
jgi:hypothetical protein